MENGARDLTIPAEGLVALRRALREEAGPLATIHTLHTAGFAAGEALFPALRRQVSEPASAEAYDGTDGAAGGDGGGDDVLLGGAASAFWAALAELLGARGWGAVRHERLHDGVGLLRSADWVEVGDGDERQPSCAFSTGMLSALLSRAAGRPVAVVEVACRAAEAEECRFAFGSEVAIHELYGRLLEDRDLEAALASL